MSSLRYLIREELEKTLHSGIASAVVLNDNGDILILQRASDSSWQPNRWNFPGGKVDIGETPEQGAIRETKEEAGIDISNLDLLKQFKTNNGWDISIFITNNFTGNVKIDYESSNAHWLKEDEIDSFEFIPNIKNIIVDVFNSVKVDI